MSAYTASILRDLASGEFVCGSHFYATMRPTFSQRLSEVNAESRAADGTDRIESRVCKRHAHNSTIHEYRDTYALRPTQLHLSGVA